MKITGFGASGGIGQHFIQLATEREHSIRAVYRSAPTVQPSGQIDILVNPNIFDPEFIAQAIGGVDLVITALGPTFVKSHNPLSKMVSPPDIHQRLARTLVSAMKASGAPTRAISASTGSMGPGDAAMGTGPRLLLGFFRTFVARNLGVVGRDLAVMEHELAASGLRRTRPVGCTLTHGPAHRAPGLQRSDLHLDDELATPKTKLPDRTDSWLSDNIWCPPARQLSMLRNG